MAAAGPLASAGPRLAPVQVAASAAESVRSIEAPRPARKRRGLLEIELGDGKRVSVDENVDAEALGRVAFPTNVPQAGNRAARCRSSRPCAEQRCKLKSAAYAIPALDLPETLAVSCVEQADCRF